jgi:hypothetical protein
MGSRRVKSGIALLAVGSLTVALVMINGGVAASADPAPTTPAPTDKATAPGTDLQDYPKLPIAPTTNSSPTPAAPDAGVFSVHLNADGSGTETVYTPPSGLSNQDLYAALKAQGIPDLRGGSANSVTPATLSSCVYGTATLFRCAADSEPVHQIHWANNGYAHPQVYFVDHTGANWPVDVSTYTWNQAQGIDSIYQYGSCPGYTGTHCVNVTDSNAGNSCWQGLTTVSWNGAYNITSAKVQLNDYQGGGTCNGVSVSYYKNANGYRQDSCHEMGHALGMGHNSSSTNSCLYGTILNSAGLLKPDSNDFTLIAQLYSTVH